MAALAQSAVSGSLCLRCVMTILNQAAADPPAFPQNDLETVLPALLVHTLEELADRHQVCKELLPLMQRWMRAQSAACAAVLQPVVVAAAVKKAGLTGYIAMLHPTMMELAVLGPKDTLKHSAAVQEISMQVRLHTLAAYFPMPLIYHVNSTQGMNDAAAQALSLAMQAMLRR